MKVSIITVCFNAEETIEETIKNVLDQTYEDIEYIVIDGQSTDCTISIVKRYEDNISVFVSERDNGVYDAMNKGVSLATGDIIFFLNSGDLFYDNHVVRNIVDCFRQNEVDMVYGDVIMIDPDKTAARIQSYEPADKIFFFESTICHQAVFVKRALFKEHGLFDTSYTICADYEWLLRVMFCHRAKRMRCNLIISVYQLGGISSNPKNYNIYLSERDNIKNRYYGKLESFIFSNKLFLRVVDITPRRILRKIKIVVNKAFSFAR